MVLRAPPGTELPRFRTTGPMTIYTLQGRWNFREYDWVAGPGSLVVASAATCHTPQVPGDGTDDATVLAFVRGDISLLDERDQVVCAASWRSLVERYDEFCRTEHCCPATWWRCAVAEAMPTATTPDDPDPHSSETETCSN